MSRTVRVRVRGDASVVRSALSADGVRLVGSGPADCLVDAGPLSGDEPEPDVADALHVLLYDPAEPAVAARALENGADHCVPVTGIDDAPLVRAAIEGATDGTGAVDQPDRIDDELLRAALDELQDVFFLFDDEGEFTAWNARLSEVTGYSDAEIARMNPTDFVAPDDREAVRAAINRVVTEGRTTIEAAFRTTDGEDLPHEFTGSVLRDDDGSLLGIVGIGRDIAERKARERVLAEQADRLKRLDRINGVIRSVLRDLTTATTREGIEAAVVDRLTDADPYRFAWVGSFERGERIEARAWAGEGSEYLDARPGPDAEGYTAKTAVRNREVEVVQEIAENPVADGWRDPALDSGFASAAAIPLSARETTVGVLCVYAPEADAFREREQAVLRELGRIVANAITAVERQRALMGDFGVELELAVDDESLFPVGLSESADGCRVELVGSTPVEDTVRQFYRIRGANRETALSVADRLADDAAFVREAGDAFLLRVTDDTTITRALAERGGRTTDAYAEGGEARVVVQLPPGADVRTLVETLDARHGVRLIARRDQPTDSNADDNRLANLTDRQQTVLETAFDAGYFASPREHTGEEIADRLDIATPTFHGHIRTAERKLVAASLDDE